MSVDTSERRRRYLLRWAALKSERSSWETHWRDLAEQIRPWSYRLLTTKKNDGKKKQSNIINGTPTWAARTLASGMMAGITSPTRPWFRLEVSDPALADSTAVRAWLDEVERIIRETFSKSNLYQGLQLVYEDLGTPGTAVLYVEEDEDDVLRAYVFPTGSYCLANSPRLAVDTVYRVASMTVLQVVERFGRENCSASTQNAYDAQQYDQWLEVLHVIEPNRNYKKGALGTRGKRWLSVWCELTGDVEAVQGILGESGYDEFPVMAPRWARTGEDVYGHSPGMEALGDCKALQWLEQKKAAVVEKIIDPPMKGPSSLQNSPVSLLPGGMTFVDGLTPSSSFEPAIVVPPQAVPVVGAEIAQHETRVKRAYYADLWLLLSESAGTMTAREVIERREEKLLQLGAVLEALQDELLVPLIDRVFSILLRKGLLPPPPEELSGAPLKTEYISIMAQAQKLLGTTAVERLVTFAGNMAAVKPEVLDKLDLDQTIDEYSKMLGTPALLVRSDDDVAEIRAARAQAAAQQRQVAQAQELATTAQKLSQADTGGDNALTSMLRGLGAA